MSELPPSKNESLRIAMQIGSWFDRKDLSLDARETEAAKLIDAYVSRLRFSPMGDNHHNANACPYCRGAVETDDDELARVRKNFIAYQSRFPPFCCAGAVRHEPNCPQLTAVKTSAPQRPESGHPMLCGCAECLMSYRLSPGDAYALGYNDGSARYDSREEEIRRAHRRTTRDGWWRWNDGWHPVQVFELKPDEDEAVAVQNCFPGQLVVFTK